MNTENTRDVRISPSESITYREAMAFQISNTLGTQRTQARRLLRLLPPHAPYDLSLFPTDWAALAHVLGCCMRNRPHNPRLALKAGALYARLYKLMRFPAAARKPGPIKRVRLHVIAVPGGVITRKTGGT